jgi:hypothetical protein
MRKTLPAILILSLIWLGYVIWPLYSVLQVARAAERKDVAFITRHVDFASVRQAFSQQIMDSYLKRTGHASPLLRGIAGSAMATSLADPIVAKFVSPEALANLLHEGWPAEALPQRPAATTGISRANVGTLWQIFASSDHGFGRFSVTVPATVSPQNAFGLDFRLSLSRLRWQLGRIRLPEPISDLIADELAKSLRGPTEPR